MTGRRYGWASSSWLSRPVSRWPDVTIGVEGGVEEQCERGAEYGDVVGRVGQAVTRAGPNRPGGFDLVDTADDPVDGLGDKVGRRGDAAAIGQVDDRDERYCGAARDMAVLGGGVGVLDQPSGREPDQRRPRLIVMGVRGGRCLRWVAGLGVALLIGYLAVGWIRKELGSTISYEGYDGPVLVSRDGRTVTGADLARCFGTQSLVADETPDRVALRLRVAIPHLHGICTSAVGIDPTLNVRLSAPLGSRPLVDPDNGRTLPWFDGRKTLPPIKLPAGYALEMTLPVTPRMPFARPTGLTGCTQEFHNAQTGGRFSITQDTGTAQPPSVPASTSAPVLVRGRRGLADQSSVTWSEDGQTITASVAITGTRMLTVPDLVAIVDSAP